MSHSFRNPVSSQPSVPVAQTPLSGRMVAPICTTGSPAVYPVIPNAYGLLPQQSQPFMTQPIVYHQVLQNVPSRTPFFTGLPSNAPRMFMPVASVPTRISPAIPDQQLLEKQRKLEKERNFQLQQERLKQFSVAGRKSNLNPDNLIDNMFGKYQSKRNYENFSSLPAKTNEFEATNTVSSQTFQKPTGKEVTSPSSHATSFASCAKARDWGNFQCVGEVVMTPKPSFPSWCTKEKVPELFKKIQTIVTNSNSNAPDTNLLFPILMSSGLSREILGRIWELVNVSSSGHLTVEEMYATLALIAVVQAGQPIKSIDILHQLPSCPVPQLSCFIDPSAQKTQNISSPLVFEKSPASATSNLSPQSKHSVHQVVMVPAAVSLTKEVPSSNEIKGEAEHVTQSSSNWTPFAGTVSFPDDDFDDFKSAPPASVSFPPKVQSSSFLASASEDDFDNFKQASFVKAPETNTGIKMLNRAPLKVKATESTDFTSQDLMSPEEDKYSAFRALQESEASSLWSEFTSFENGVAAATADAVDPSSSSVLVTENIDDSSKTKSATDIKNQENDEEFGDFIHAPVVTMSVPPSSTTAAATVTPNFADFSNFKQSLLNNEQQFPIPQFDDEFGEFASSAVAPMSLKPDDFFFHRFLKDNVSLTESQSVSSLELGTFDGGGGHNSEESKSSLSRQGSIPSLDLKTAGLDGTDSEDCFGEVPSYVSQKSPSPISNAKGSDNNEISSAPIRLVFQTSILTLTDKYSVMRQEKVKVEDLHVSCWMRCLLSAVSILQNTKKIFNQLSCSSICHEVLTSEEGGNYVLNVIEIYKVICRIALASKSLGKQTETVTDTLNEADRVWSTVSGFLAGSALMPTESSLDFSRSVLKPELENNVKACGLCLLNIELQSKSFNREECPKLSYGGRTYHSTCANFWVNCVDPLLPALTLPQLL